MLQSEKGVVEPEVEPEAKPRKPGGWPKGRKRKLEADIVHRVTARLTAKDLENFETLRASAPGVLESDGDVVRFALAEAVERMRELDEKHGERSRKRKRKS